MSQSDAIDAKQFPKGVLIAIALLISFAMLAAVTAKRTDIGATRLDVSNVAQSRDVTFVDKQDGNIIAFDAKSGAQIADIKNSGNGFVGVVLKGFSRNRALLGFGPELPFRISTLADGRAMIEDPSTGHVVMLGAFGSDNRKAFSQLISERSETP